MHELKWIKSTKPGNHIMDSHHERKYLLKIKRNLEKKSTGAWWCKGKWHKVVINGKAGVNAIDIKTLFREEMAENITIMERKTWHTDKWCIWNSNDNWQK